MLTAADLALRKTGLTATDMTILAGASPYGKTVHDVYLSKCGEEEPSEVSQAMGLGHLLEPVALALLAEERGIVISPGRTETHPSIKWAIATPDGNVLEGDTRIAVAEAKAVGFRMASRWGENGDPNAIPDEVRIQVQWQQIVTQTKMAHVVALIGTEARFYEIEHDDDLSSALLEMGEKFWTTHVLAKQAPEVDGSEASGRMVRGLFRKSTAGIVTAPVEAQALVEEYIAARAAADEAEKRKATAQARLCGLIGEHEGIQGPWGLATWKLRAGSTDWKALAQKLGATKSLEEQYKRDGVRVLNVKAERTS
jgi:putative phage-type endonuclease